MFSNQLREQVKSENPGISFTDIGRKLGEMWREMEPETKKGYEDRATEAKDKYMAEKKAWLESKQKAVEANASEMSAAQGGMAAALSGGMPPGVMGGVSPGMGLPSGMAGMGMGMGMGMNMAGMGGMMGMPPGMAPGMMSMQQMPQMGMLDDGVKAEKQAGEVKTECASDKPLSCIDQNGAQSEAPAEAGTGVDESGQENSEQNSDEGANQAESS